MNRLARTAKPTASRKRRVLRALLGVVAAGGFLFSAQVAAACDFCESSYEGGCDSCDAGPGHGLSVPKLKLPSPGKAVFKTLDAFAGGIEKVMGFDKCSVDGVGCDSNCDDGCDAALMSDLMMQATPMHVPHTQSPHAYSVAPQLPSAPHMSAPRIPHAAVPAPMHAAPMHSAPTYSTPRVPVTPAPMTTQPRARMSQPMIVSPQSEPYQSIPSTSAREQYNDFNSLPPDQTNLAPIEDGPVDRATEMNTAPRMSQPRVTQPRVTQPRVTQPRATQPRTTQPRATQPRTTQPRTTQPRTTQPRTTQPRPTAPPMPVPDTKPNPPKDEGSLFDSLGDDPFSDDEVRLPKPYRSVQPSNYRMPKAQPTRSGFQLHGPQSSRTRQPSKMNAAQQRSVAMMRQANGMLPSGRTVAQSHSSHAAQHHASSAQQAAGRSTTRRSGTQRAAATRSSSASNHAHQVSHQQVSQRRVAQQKATSLHRQHGQPQLKPVPQPRVSTGQRHATPRYSSYGHTTNR